MNPPPEDGASASTGAMPCPTPGEEATLHIFHQPPGPPRHERARVGSTRRWYRKMAHPPAAGGQPLPLLAQHQAFFATLQPAIQLANPASQSYGSEDVTHPPP